MSVLNSLMNEQSEKSSLRAVTWLDPTEIETNPLNKAPINDVEALAEVLVEEGILSPLVAYKVSNGVYRLISGERRLTAALSLHLDLVPVQIIEKPENELDERLMILTFNNQREESVDYIKIKVEEYADIYDQLRNSGKRPEGRKRDWIAKKMGGSIKGRTIQKYLTGDYGTSPDSEPGNLQGIDKPNKKEKDKLTEIIKVIKKVNKLFMEIENEDYSYRDENELFNLKKELGILIGNADVNKTRINVILGQRER